MEIGKIIQWPDKWTLLLIIVLSMIMPSLTLFVIANTPTGFEYGHGRDGIIWVSAMKSYMWGYADPFGPGNNSVFENPWMGSIYLLTFLGFFTTFLDAELVFHAASAIFAILFFVIVYNIVSIFVNKNDARKAFLFFVFASGSLGWILYLFFRVPIEGIFPNAFLHLLWGAGISTTTVIYWCASLVFGYLAILVFAKSATRNGLIAFSLFTAFSTIIYPLFGAMILAITLIYSIVNNRIKQFLWVIPFFVIAAVPWIYFNSKFYTRYLVEFSYASPLALLFRGLLVIPPAAYFLYVFMKRRENVGGKNAVFLVLWALLVVAAVLVPSNLIGLTTERLTYMVWLPLSILGFLGIKEFFTRYNKISYNTVVTIIIILTIPTVILWFVPGLQTTDYFPASDIEALKFLKNQPPGTILASYNISVRAPYYAEKRALRGGGQLFEELDTVKPIIKAYERFYSDNATEAERKGILELYKIQYVIFGNQESLVSDGKFNPDNLTCLTKILDGPTKVYSKTT